LFVAAFQIPVFQRTINQNKQPAIAFSQTLFFAPKAKYFCHLIDGLAGKFYQIETRLPEGYKHYNPKWDELRRHAWMNGSAKAD
jgi:hypothetical protein